MIFVYFCRCFHTQHTKMTKKRPDTETTKLGNKVLKGKKKKEGGTSKETKTKEKAEEAVGRKETVRFLCGLALLIIALFMLLAFV